MAVPNNANKGRDWCTASVSFSASARNGEEFLHRLHSLPDVVFVREWSCQVGKRLLQSHKGRDHLGIEVRPR